MALLREPSEDDIAGFTGIAQLPRDKAILWLKAHNNDLNNAVNAFFENPSAPLDQQGQVAWDEAHFHTDETNPVHQGQSQPSFNVHASDTLNPNVFIDGAPSRPPSRVSTRGTNTVNDEGPSKQLSFADREQEEMDRAMAISMTEGQDMGVLDNSKQTFGPATRKHYDTETWSMVPAGGQAQEIFLNPEPIDRKRHKNTPAFIKPTPSGHNLSALIKILHAIPMAREALLNRSQTLPDYGHDKDWWEGTAIKVLRIVNMDSDGRQVGGDDIVYETQRLMAFLDETDRAYGSIDILAGLEKLSQYESDKVSQFFKEWSEATTRSAPDAPLADIFLSVGNRISMEATEPVEDAPFCCLDVRVEAEVSGKGLTLYEALDDMIWPSSGLDEETCLAKVGDVFTLEVSNLAVDGSGLGVEVPAIWYPDRYLPSSKKEAKDMLTHKAALKVTLEASEETEEKLKYFQRPDGSYVPAAYLLQRTTTYYEQTAAYQKASKRLGVAGVSDEAKKNQIPYERLVEEMKAMTEKITNKLKVHEKLRDSAREKMKEISKLYTKASSDPSEPPYHKYTLRGVSTNAHTVYVLEKTKADEEDDVLSIDTKDWQWWKIEYLSGDAKPVLNTVNEDEVLTAASTDSRKALLVYASEHAMSYEAEKLPPQLHNFVRADNLSFSSELENATHFHPTSPSKRKADDEDDDLDAQLLRSHPYDRNQDNAIPLDELDPNPPGYDVGPAAPSTMSRSRLVLRKTSNTSSYDDKIPASLQATGPTVNPTSLLNQDESIDRRQEMQERGGGQSLLRGPQESTEQSGYKLGSYKPVFSMEVHEEDGVQ